MPQLQETLSHSKWKLDNSEDLAALFAVLGAAFESFIGGQFEVGQQSMCLFG